MSEERSRMIANAAAYLNISGERFIECAISSALLSLAERDKVLCFIFSRSGGADWQELEAAAHSDVSS
jgi:hypothetical protein